MKHVTATEARKNWFRLLDEAAEGEVVVIEREGIRLVLQREKQGREASTAGMPSYEGLIWATDADQADHWSWEWSGPGEPLSSVGKDR